MKKFALPMLVFCLLLLSGCTDNELKELRFDCMALSSYSAQSIPSCKTQEVCYEAVEKSFSFDETSVPYPSSSYLHSYKNHLARSWLYYNKALESIRAINKACSSESIDQQLLKSNIDNFSNSIYLSFTEIEEANRDSFLILDSLKKSLENEEIGAIKEEPLFNDYLLLLENKEMLEGKQDADPAIYSGRYLIESARFDAYAKKLGFSKSMLSDFPASEVVSYSKSKIPNLGSIGPFQIAAFAKELLDFLMDKAFMEESIGLLKSSNAFEFFIIFDSFAGTEDSMPSLLSKQLLDYSKHKQEADSRISYLEKAIEENFSACDSYLKSFDSEVYSKIGPSFLEELY